MQRVILLSTVLCLATSALTVGGQEMSSADVVDAFHRAVTEGDSTSALSYLLPDVIIFESGGSELSREEYRSHHLRADISASRQSSRTLVDRKTEMAGDVAWILSQTRTVAENRNPPSISVGTETMVLRRTSEGWRIAHIHWSSRRVRRSG